LATVGISVTAFIEHPQKETSRYATSRTMKGSACDTEHVRIDRRTLNVNKCRDAACVYSTSSLHKRGMPDVAMDREALHIYQ
ncbi:MAG: hypothetical protein ACREX6_05270, partial [Casimicrobiaceae bacterium]